MGEDGPPKLPSPSSSRWAGGLLPVNPPIALLPQPPSLPHHYDSAPLPATGHPSWITSVVNVRQLRTCPASIILIGRRRRCYHHPIALRSVAILSYLRRITAALTSPARESLLGLDFLTVPSSTAKRGLVLLRGAQTTRDPHSKHPGAINLSVAASLGFLVPIVHDLAITRALVQVAGSSHPDEREAGAATRAPHLWRERVKEHGRI